MCFCIISEKRGTAMRRGFEKESVEILTGMIREKEASGEYREWKGRLKKDAEI